MRDVELTLACVQMTSGENRDSNVQKAEHYIDIAIKEHNADVIVLPEFFNIPYVFQWRDYKHIDRAEHASGPTICRMREVAKSRKVALIATIFEEDSAGIYYDTAFFIDEEGEIRGKYRKVHPAAVQSLEKIYFRYGSHYPIVNLRGLRFGAIICYDTFFPETARCTAVQGAEVIIVPFAAPKVDPWRAVMMTRAFENGVWFAPANKVGIEGEWTFGGRSMIVEPTGEVAEELDDVAEGVIATRISRSAVYGARREKPMLRDRRPDLYSPICTPTEDVNSGK